MFIAEVKSFMGKKQPSFYKGLGDAHTKMIGSVKDVTVPLYANLINERNSRRQFTINED